MHAIAGNLAPLVFAAVVAVAVGAGFVKGAVGFALPMILISVLGSFLPGHEALAALILPTLMANLAQAFRQGAGAAWRSVVRFRRMIAMIVLGVSVSAQFVLSLPPWLMLVTLGVPITAFAAHQLTGRPLVIAIRHRTRAEYALGLIGGLFGGISGVTSPPLLVYLLSIGTEKHEQVRAQGVMFLVASSTLTLAHLESGVLNAATLPLSAALMVPTAAGIWLGVRLQDRLNPARFRYWTLVVLALTGLNLIRRGLLG